MGGGRGWRQQWEMPVNLPGSAIVRLSCTDADAVADEGENILFLKTQEAGIRGESGGGRRQWEQQHSLAAKQRADTSHSLILEHKEEGFYMTCFSLCWILLFFFIISTKAKWWRSWSIKNIQPVENKAIRMWDVKPGSLNHSLMCYWCKQDLLSYCTAGTQLLWVRLPASTTRIRGKGGGFGAGGCWRVVRKQEQTGEGGDADNWGWEPMSPWNKDRPPVHPKSTCEFKVKIRDSGKPWIKCEMFVATILFLLITCSPAVFVFDATNSHCHSRFILICD